MIASYKYVKSTNLNALKKQSDITLSNTSDEMMNIFDARGQSYMYKNGPLCVGHDRTKDQEADQRTPFAWEDEAELQEL